jgi:hypothetical protein
VSTTVDRELVLRLLQDETLSFREIARRANCSDWSVRSIAREFDGPYWSDDAQNEPLTAAQCWIVAGVFALVVGGMCFAVWRMPPLDSESM